MIAALQTTYRGITYRSRTEARWAVFFDHMGWRVNYEPEGVTIEGTRYLPDFYLPEFKTWVEVKGDKPTEGEIRKCRTLARATGNAVWLLSGAPQSYEIYTFPIERPKSRAEFRTCRRCEIPVVYWTDGSACGWEEVNACEDAQRCGDKLPVKVGRIENAIMEASAERFGVHPSTSNPLRSKKSKPEWLRQFRRV